MYFLLKHLIFLQNTDPVPQRLYRPAPASTVSEAMAASAIKFSSASYSHSIARLAGIQTELEVSHQVTTHCVPLEHLIYCSIKG